MGGRGSGGGKSGGGGSASKAPTTKDYEENRFEYQQYYEHKFAEMTDAELDKAYLNTRNQMANYRAKYEFERKKLAKMNEEFKDINESDTNYTQKANAHMKQIEKVGKARIEAEARETVHYLTVNEKYNVRAKQTVDDLKNMSNGQLNSFYNKSYRETHKARNKVERTKNSKTREKYQKIYDTHDDNFWAANQERSNRGLDGKDW